MTDFVPCGDISVISRRCHPPANIKTKAANLETLGLEARTMDSTGCPTGRRSHSRSCFGFEFVTRDWKEHDVQHSLGPDVIQFNLVINQYFKQHNLKHFGEHINR